MINAVAQFGPIAVVVDASNWSAYDSGIYNGCDQINSDINHGVVLVGYGPGYWLVRNSWSASWGEAGYIRLYRDDNQATTCQLDVTPLDGTACAGETDPVTTCGTCGILYDSAYPTNVVASSSASNFFLQ